MAKFIKKASPEELLTINRIASTMDNINLYKVKIKNDIISFICADKYVSDIFSTMEKYLTPEKKENIESNINEKNYNEIIRFKLVDKEDRLFVMMLKFTSKDEDNFWVSKWEYVGKRLPINELADKYLPFVTCGEISRFSPNFALSPMESRALDT